MARVVITNHTRMLSWERFVITLLPTPPLRTLRPSTSTGCSVPRNTCQTLCIWCQSDKSFPGRRTRGRHHSIQKIAHVRYWFDFETSTSRKPYRIATNEHLRHFIDTCACSSVLATQSRARRLRGSRWGQVKCTFWQLGIRGITGSVLFSNDMQGSGLKHSRHLRL